MTRSSQRSLWAFTLWCLCSPMAGAQSTRPIDFNRDVRPILSDACFHCHGPDKAKRKAALHFDTEEGAMADLGGYRAVVPGKPNDSELFKRITTSDKTKRMPPPSSALTLSAAQIDTLRRWIAEGAKWQKHWAFIPPARPALPEVKDKAWARNPIDRFVLAEIERAGLRPSPEADRATLIRRASLDLTGLPPSPEDVDAFVSDKAPDAYEKVVDRLLRSPRYGERMAQRWLDGARYADTSGYQNDGERVMWRWRDWVIDAFNDNMPFDRFTVEQIAGDMLPGATLDQKIATGFNRNHRGNSEGGVIPEEFAVEYVVDRVDTTSTVWLGLSAGCARCHNHKYDPISQKEFYQLFAYFNNIPEHGKARKYGNSPPYIQAPTRAQQAQLLLMKAQLRLFQERFAALQPDLATAQRSWERTLDFKQAVEWTFTRHLAAHFPLDQQPVEASARPTPAQPPANDGPTSALASSSPQSAPGIDAVSLTPRGNNSKPRLGPGRIGSAIHFDGQNYLDAGDVAGFGFFDKFSMGAWIRPASDAGGAILSRMVDTDRADGYLLMLQGGKIHVQLVKRWLDDAVRIETEEALAPNRWYHVFFTYDGSRTAKGIQIYIDGKPAHVKVNLDDLNQNFNTAEPLRIGAGAGRRFHGAIDEVRIYDDVITPADVAVIANTDAIPVLANLAPERRTPAQRHKLRTCFLEAHAPETLRDAYKNLLRAEKELELFDASIPTSMVMEEMATPRDTHILLRGEYDKKGKKVVSAVPEFLPPLPKGAPNNRLGFARWLVARENPLTARVAVNRYWQMLFGAGIVKTVEDFGAQGDWPSHPDLLDWLAVEFMSGTPAWDTKRLLRTIVTSATYRQASRVTPELHRADPENRLLARGPRFRLSADVIRDQALAASGLLIEKVGGPSVKPYQPAGLVKELTGTEDFVQDHGPSLYRRSLYTHWKRTVAPPTMMNFDAANRETCVVRETRTNTPLQALNLMNDVTYVEAARVLAERILVEGGATPAARLSRAFRLATARAPHADELAVLVTALDRHQQNYRANLPAAHKLVSAGEAPRNRSLEVAEHAAYTAICNLILNLDETITKE